VNGSVPARVAVADTDRLMKSRDDVYRPRGNKHWPLLRDLARELGITAVRLSGIKGLRKFGWRYVASGKSRSKQWNRCVHPVDAKRLREQYAAPHLSPPGWIAQHDGALPFPDHFPKLPSGVLVSARIGTRRLGEPLEEEKFKIRVPCGNGSRAIRPVLHFRLAQIERLNRHYIRHPDLNPRVKVAPEPASVPTTAEEQPKAEKKRGGGPKPRYDAVADDTLLRDYHTAGCGEKEFARRRGLTVKYLRATSARIRARLLRTNSGKKKSRQS
jgi:hypothetical protein